MTFRSAKRWLAELEGSLQRQALEDVPEAPDFMGRLRPVEHAGTPSPSRRQVLVDHVLRAIPWPYL